MTVESSIKTRVDEMYIDLESRTRGSTTLEVTICGERGIHH